MSRPHAQLWRGAVLREQKSDGSGGQPGEPLQLPLFPERHWKLEHRHNVYGVSFRDVREEKASALTTTNSEESISGNWVLSFWRGLQSETQVATLAHTTSFINPSVLATPGNSNRPSPLHNAAGQARQRHNKHCTQYRHGLRSERRGSRTQNSSLGNEEESDSLECLAAKPFTSALIHTSAAPPSIQTRCTGWTWQCDIAQNVQWKGGKKENDNTKHLPPSPEVPFPSHSIRANHELQNSLPSWKKNSGRALETEKKSLNIRYANDWVFKSCLSTILLLLQAFQTRS